MADGTGGWLAWNGAAALVFALVGSTQAVEPRIFATGQRSIYSARLDGSDAKVIVTGNGDALGLDAVNLKLYYGTKGLMPDLPAYRSNLDGSQAQEFLSGWRPMAYDLDPANNRIFFTTWGSHNAYVADLSDPKPTTWHYGLNAIVDMQFDPPSKQLFVANASDMDSGDQIWAIPLDGPLGKQTIQGVYGLSGMAVDTVHRKLYFSAKPSWATFDQFIYRSELDGSDMQILIDNTALGTSAPCDVDVVPELNAIFWADKGLGAVFRADLDGTHMQRILDVPEAMQVAVLVPEPQLAMGLGMLAMLLRRRCRQAGSGLV